MVHEPAERASQRVRSITAFRCDEATQPDWRDRLVSAGVRTVLVIRTFTDLLSGASGVLFEIATDGPGFLIDEPADALAFASTS
jgi:hypothetical protein